MEIIFPIRPVESLEAVKIAAQDNPVNNHTCFLSGLHTKPLKITFDKFHTFGIQMKPIAVKALFGMPLSEIRDYFVEGAIIFDTICLLEDQLHSKSCFEERAKWFENFLLRKINETANVHVAMRLERAIKNHICMAQNGPARPIEDIMGYSRTQTYRLFNEWFGISSHSYQKLLQFISTVETLHDRKMRLVDAAYTNGYFDQAHCIRAFREFAGMTPGEYRIRMSPLPGQIIHFPRRPETDQPLADIPVPAKPQT